MSKILASPAAKRIATEMNISLGKIKSLSSSKYLKARDVLAQPKAVKITPLASKMATYHDIDTNLVNTSDNKIKKSDILNYLDRNTKQSSASNSSENVIPLAGMRKVIAENMMNSLLTQAQTTVFAELDSTKLVEFHKNLKDKFKDKYEVKLTITHLLIKMVTLALKENPMLNTALIDNHIHIYDEFNIGIATALDDGLIVPVVKDCENLGLVDICTNTNSLIDKARAGKLKPSEYSGGTFTISNLGNVAVDFFTPILNSPQTGILGVARTVKKPVVVNDEIVIRSMTGFNLTYDHRVIDGMVAARFMNSLNEILNNPVEILL